MKFRTINEEREKIIRKHRVGICGLWIMNMAFCRRKEHRTFQPYFYECIREPFSFMYADKGMYKNAGERRILKDPTGHLAQMMDFLASR